MYSMCSWMYRTSDLLNLEPLTQFPIFGEIRPGNRGGVKAVKFYICHNSHDYCLSESNFPQFVACHKLDARNISTLIPIACDITCPLVNTPPTRKL